MPVVVRVKTSISSAGNKTLPESRQRGFTLLELIVVLVIAAAMMSIVPPLISSALPGAEIKSAARQLAAGLRYARNKALTSDEEAILMLDLDAKKFSVTGKKKSFSIPHGLKVTLVTAESEMVAERKGAIRFFPEGGSTGGRVSVANNTRGYDIDVDWLTGKVRILEKKADS